MNENYAQPRAIPFFGRLTDARILTVGVNPAFSEFPEAVALTDEFVTEYQSYAEAIFSRRQQLYPFEKLDADKLTLSLYTSAEYSAILERGLLESPFGEDPHDPL